MPQKLLLNTVNISATGMELDSVTKSIYTENSMKFITNYLANRKAKQSYDDTLLKFLSDGKLDETERKELETFAMENNLSADDLKEAHKRAASVLFKDISADSRITEEEKVELEALIKYFGLNLGDFDFNQKAFNKFYTLALIEKGVLPTPELQGLNIVFKNDEVPHWLCGGSLKKLKKVTQSVGYSGLSGSIRIMKGVRYRVGSIKLAPQTREIMVEEDVGNFWMTNQRMGFLGKKKSVVLPYNKILSFELYGDGISLYKEGRENPYFIGLEDVEVPAMILSSILNKDE